MLTVHAGELICHDINAVGVNLWRGSSVGFSSGKEF